MAGRRASIRSAMFRKACRRALIAQLFALCCLSSAWTQQPNPADAKSIFEHGQRALLNREYATAERDFNQVIRLKANSAPAYINLGVVYLRTNRIDAAVQALQRAKKLEPGAAGIDLNLGLAYFKKGEFKKAALHFGNVLKSDPNNLQARYLEGSCHFMMDDFRQTADALEPIFPAEKNDLDYLYMLGVSYGMLKQDDAAHKIFTRLAEVGGDSPQLHLLLGKAYFALGQNQRAEEEFQQSISGGALPFAHYYLGALYERAGKHDQAGAEFEKEIEIAPDNPWAYKELSELKLDREGAAGAIALLEKGATHNPDAPELFATLGKDYLQAGDVTHSIAALRRAIAIDGENSSYHYQLGRALFKAGHSREANTEIARGRALGAEVMQGQMQALSRDAAK
jgi:tetratricopeptide (TPR) repeat protein